MPRTYTPGVCNLGDAEARRRNAAGWIGLAITAVLEGVFLYYHVSPLIRIVLFIPAVFSATGFLQGVMHFCANFGMRGIFNMSATVGNTNSVAQEQYRALDRAKAWRIIIYSVVIGVVVAFLAYVS